MFNLLKLVLSFQSGLSSRRNANSSSCGLSKEQGKPVSTDLIYKDPSRNAAMAVKLSQSEASIACSSDSEEKGSLTLARGLPLEVALSESTTASLLKGNHSSNQPTPLSLDCEIGLQKASEHLLDATLQESIFIRFCVFPFLSFLGPDEKVWFKSILRDRYGLYRRGYGKTYLFLWDVCVTADFVRRYIGAAVSQLIEVNINLKK